MRSSSTALFVLRIVANTWSPFRANSSAVSSPKPLLHPGPHLLRAAATLMAVAQRVTDLPPALTPEALRVIAGTTYLGSNEKAVRDLGFVARPLREGMDQTLEHELRVLAKLRPPR